MCHADNVPNMHVPTSLAYVWSIISDHMPLGDPSPPTTTWDCPEDCENVLQIYKDIGELPYIQAEVSPSWLSPQPH